MKLNDVLDFFKLLLERVANPVGLTGLWIVILWSTGTIDFKTAFNEKLVAATLLRKLDAWASLLGLELKPWHWLVLGTGVFVLIYEFTVGLLLQATPWKIRWDHASFWRASKAWKEVFRLRGELSLSGELTLSEIAHHLRLSEERLKGDFERSHSDWCQAIDKRSKIWHSVNAGISAFLIITAVLGMATAIGIVNSGILRPEKIPGSVLVLLVLLVLTRIGCEALTEHAAHTRAAFTLRSLDKQSGELGFEVDAAEWADMSVYLQIAESTAPGFPYSRIWLLHLVRQIPLCGHFGFYPWRSLDDLHRDLPNFPEEARNLRSTGPDRRSRWIGAMILPSGFLQWTVAWTLQWLVRLGLIRNGGATIGANINFQKLWSARRAIRASR